MVVHIRDKKLFELQHSLTDCQNHLSELKLDLTRPNIDLNEKNELQQDIACIQNELDDTREEWKQIEKALKDACQTKKASKKMYDYEKEENLLVKYDLKPKETKNERSWY